MFLSRLCVFKWKTVRDKM